MGQRLGQLEDARHVLAVLASQLVFVEAASEGGEQLSASKAVNMRGFEAGLLQSLDRLILRQVKRQQLCISSVEASVREVDVLLLRLDAAEGDELRQLSSSSHEGVSAVAEVVVEDAARRRGSRVKGC